MEITQEEASEELLRRFRERIVAVTPRALCTGKNGKFHEFQYRILCSVALCMVLMCSRRAGKSRVCCSLLLLTAIKTDGVACVYLALTKEQAGKIFRRHWLPVLRKFKIPCRNSGLTTYFPNGSYVAFGGTDDLATITHQLGDSMAGGMCVMDEQQSDPGVLETAAVTIFGPMLNETTDEAPMPGRLIIAGTVPDSPTGYFWKLWEDNFDDDLNEPKPNSAWECWAWSRFENPFELDNEMHMMTFCRQFKLDVNDPKVLRDWKGMRVFTDGETCLRYKVDSRWESREMQWSIEAREQNRFAPFVNFRFVKPPREIDTYWVGIKPSNGNDKFAITLFGTANLRDKGIWQIGEASTEKGADPAESEWIAILKELKLRYGRIARVIRNPESGNDANEVLLRSHRILIEPGIKGPGSLKGMYDNVRNHLLTGSLHILEKSELENDFIKTTWDKKSKDKNEWKLSAKHIPSAGASAVYVIPFWTKTDRNTQDSFLDEMTEEQRDAWEAKQALARKFDEKREVKKRPKRAELWRMN